MKDVSGGRRKLRRRPGFDIRSEVNALFYICLIALHTVKARGLCGEENVLPMTVIDPSVVQILA
jgi:hypothetical protein